MTEELRSSTRSITGCLSRDEQQIPDPWDLLQSSYSRDYLPMGSVGEVTLKIKQVHVIPEILLSQYEGKECRCFMGLLPDIGRVWMTVDNRLFLWDYATGRDFTCFDELESVIIDVALVRPKKDIFVPSIKYLLVVVTATEVVLLGVSFEGDGSVDGSVVGDGQGTNGTSNISQDLIISHTSLLFPTDDINMLAVVGSKSGRIFSGGQDGHIYEFFYQAEEGWLTRKCRKMNRTATPLASLLTPTFLRLASGVAQGKAIISLAYDGDRNLLYALREDSSIEGFHLGRDDDSFTSLGHLKDLYEQASRLCPTGILSKKGFKVISIQVVSEDDSAFIHLMAVTQSGVRLLFTTLPRDQRAWARNQILASSPSNHSPTYLELIHVRLPPEESRHRDARRLAHTWNPNVHTAFYRAGVTITASAMSEEEDVIIASLANQALAHAPTRNLAPTESTMDILIEGKIWDMAEDRSTNTAVIAPATNTVATNLNTTSAATVMPFSSSFVESISPWGGQPRKFLLLSNAGVYVLGKTTAVEELQRLLIEGNGNVDGEAIRIFFETFGAEQGCFLCIVLICILQSAWKGSIFSPPALSLSGSVLRDPKMSASLAIWAMNALLRYGGEPRIIETPINATSTTIVGSRIEFEYSHLNRALHLYFARLVGAFWNRPLGRFTEPSTNVIMSLHAFGEFLDRNPTLHSRTLNHSPHQQQQQLQQQIQLEEAFLAENKSISLLRSLVKSTLELLSFLSLSLDYGVLSMVLSDGGNTTNLEFADLLSTPRGRDLIADLGNLLVQQQLKMKSSVDSLCQILLQRCPSFFGDTTVVLYQGREQLERAMVTRDPADRMLALQDSLRLFLRGAPSLSLPILSDICHKYQQMAYFAAVIELTLTVSRLVDPQNIALVHWRSLHTNININNINHISNINNGSNINSLEPMQLDSQQQDIVNTRDAIYSLTFDALRTVHGIANKKVIEILPIVTGIDMDELQQETMAKAVQSKDELFHLRLYDWLVEERLSGVLLSLDTPFLRSYLESKFYQEKAESHRDLLWKLHAKHGRYLDAARVLDALAGSPEFGLILSERMERLSLALGNARSTTQHTLDVANYIQDLEERLDVAKVQMEILEQVLSQYGEVAEVEELNARLYDISTLFNQFTQPMKLWECSLRIVHCAAYQDHLLIHSLWKSILDKAVSGKRFDILAQKVAELARRLYPSPYAFPLNFVMDSVVLMALKYGQSPEWLAGVFTQSGIPLKDLLNQAWEFIHSPSPFWSRPENREYLINVFIIFANRLLDGGVMVDVLALVEERLASLLVNPAVSSSNPSIKSKLLLLQERIQVTK